VSRGSRLDKAVIAAVMVSLWAVDWKSRSWRIFASPLGPPKLGLPDAELGFSPTGGLTYLLKSHRRASWALHLAMNCADPDGRGVLANWSRH